MWNYRNGWHIQKEQDENKPLPKNTVNCRLKALDLYIFVRGFRRALKTEGLMTRKENVIRNKLKQCTFCINWF